jgi:amino acid transporter
MLAFPGGKFVGKLHKNFRGCSLPIIGIVIMSLLTVPLSFFRFDVLVGWSGLMTAVTQLIQVVVFVYCRKQSIGVTQSGIANAKPIEERFVIAGGWIGAGICAGSLALVSLGMCVVSGWQSLVISTALVGVCFLIYGIEQFVRKSGSGNDHGDLVDNRALRDEKDKEEIECPVVDRVKDICSGLGSA